jgi:hypothetical protein
MMYTDRGSRERSGVVCVAWARAAVLPVLFALGTTIALSGSVRAESAVATAPDSAAVAIAQAARDGQITDAIAQRLEPKQLFELIRNAQDVRAKQDKHLDWEGVIVPVGVVGSFFTACVLAIFFPLYYAYRRSRRQQDIMMAMVEKGMTIPEHLVGPSPRNRNDLRTGIVLLCTGAGICLALPGVGGFPWQLGFVPLAIGAGYAVVGVLDRSRAKGSEKGSQGAAGSDNGESAKA